MKFMTNKEICNMVQTYLNSENTKSLLFSELLYKSYVDTDEDHSSLKLLDNNMVIRDGDDFSVKIKVRSIEMQVSEFEVWQYRRTEDGKDLCNYCQRENGKMVFDCTTTNMGACVHRTPYAVYKKQVIELVEAAMAYCYGKEVLNNMQIFASALKNKDGHNYWNNPYYRLCYEYAKEHKYREIAIAYDELLMNKED